MKNPAPLLLLLLTTALAAPATRALAQDGSTRYTITTVADNTAPNSPFSTFSGTFPAINDSGTVVFRATLTDGTQTLYSSVGGVLTPLASSGSASGAFTGFTDSVIALGNNGTVVFAGSTSAGPALFSIPQGGGTLTTVVDGSVTPASFGERIASPSINDAGTVSFGALGTSDPNTGIHQGGYYTVPATGGTPAALFANGNNGSLFPSVINNAGQVAFIIDPGVPEFSGLPDPGLQVWRIDAPGATPVVLAMEDATFKTFIDQTNIVDLDDSGTVLFSATRTDSTQAVYLATAPGNAQPVVATGSSGFTELENVAFGKADAVVFYGLTAAGGGGTFDGTDPIANQIFFDPYRGGNFTALTGVTHDQINASGQIVFTYELDNGINGIAVATPKAATSPTPTPSPSPTPGTSTLTAAVDNTAISRSAGQSATVTFTRTGDLSAKIKVKYVLSSALKEGKDYTGPTGATKIKAGKSSASFTIQPLAGGADGKIKITVQPETGYTLEGNKLKVKIKD